MNEFFAQLVGQDQAVELLTQAINQERVAPAYLFTGPDGVGRSLAARCFVEQLFCAIPKHKQQQVQTRLQLGNHPDMLWVQPTILHQGQRMTAAVAADAGLKPKSQFIIRTDQIREIASFLSRPPLEAPRSVVVLEQAETMAEAAANALLKTLEEPGQATLILIAPAPESLLPTLVSRCQRIPFYRLDYSGMAQVLRQNGHEHILNQSPVLRDIPAIGIAQGSPGEAIASWQQLEAIPTNLLSSLQQLPNSRRDALNLAREIDKTLDMKAQLWLVDYLQHCYWQQFLSGVIHSSTSRLAVRVLPLEQLEKARQYLLSYAQPRLVWEVTLLAMI